VLGIRDLNLTANPFRAMQLPLEMYQLRKWLIKTFPNSYIQRNRNIGRTHILKNKFAGTNLAIRV